VADTVVELGTVADLEGEISTVRGQLVGEVFNCFDDLNRNVIFTVINVKHLCETKQRVECLYIKYPRGLGRSVSIHVVAQIRGI
jgi:hypothetical protein